MFNDDDELVASLRSLLKLAVSSKSKDNNFLLPTTQQEDKQEQTSNRKKNCKIIKVAAIVNEMSFDVSKKPEK